MSIGHQLERAQLYATDEHGRRIPKRQGNLATHCHINPTKSHALSHPERENPAELEQQALMCARLTPEEQAIFDMQAFGTQETVEREIDDLELDQHIADGWTVVHHHGGRAVLKRDFIHTATYAEMAKYLGLTERQVHRKVSSAHAKIRKAREGLR